MPLSPEEQDFLASVRRWVARDLTPHVAAWDEAGSFPRTLYRQAAAVGVLSAGFAESAGGVPASAQLRVALQRELCRAGSGGLLAGLMSHGIALPPIAALGSPAQVGRWLPPVLRGEQIAALAVTEPGGGSDVANLRTTAVLEGDHYRVDGEKAFITSGMRADLLTVAVRTGEPGAAGVSLLVVEGEPEGLTRSPLAKSGWWCSDTALLRFDGVRVPTANLLGAPGLGFLGLMHNFNAERLGIAAAAWGFGEECLQEALAWTRDRETFGKPLIQRQVVRHQLVDCRMRLEAVRALLVDVAGRIDAGEEPVADVCLLKNLATETLEQVASRCVQLLGGSGYIRGGKTERIFRETKVLSIGGGASEVLADLAARQLGWV
jgi:acyl-CoA dehydrogenase